MQMRLGWRKHVVMQLLLFNWIKEWSVLTHMNFMATNLKPLASKRLMIFPTMPRWTPSGFTIMKVRSLFAAIALENNEKNAKIEPIIKAEHAIFSLLQPQQAVKGGEQVRFLTFDF